MRSSILISLIVVLSSVIFTNSQQIDEDVSSGYEKRAAMRNALVRFGRAGGMRNALVRFGKRSSALEEAAVPDYSEMKRNGAPQPFVRFGRSGGHFDHMHDILSTLQKLEMANS
uniref:Uncharacterized protein n=1 Tax=Acrobeloides nanus TaxID=290746 RepID=A0A914DWG4_9BILA